MGPFERLARRKPYWLFFFCLALTIAGAGLVLMLGGFLTGYAVPFYAGLILAAPGSIAAALIVASAQFPRKSVTSPETSGQHPR